MRNVFKVLIGKPEGKRQLGKILLRTCPDICHPLAAEFGRSCVTGKVQNEECALHSFGSRYDQ
jgi:hypothetical protein